MDFEYSKENGLLIDNCSEVVTALTVVPIVKSTFNKKPESFELFTKVEDKVKVPRYWAIDKYNLKLDISKGSDLKDLKFIGELRTKQLDIVNDILPKIREIGGGIISLPCGMGKTCIAIYLACLLKLKTLVVVHKNFLLNQWVESITKFSNAKIGIIQQNTIDIENKDIVIGMLQSLSMKDYHHTIFSSFDILIVDEVHNVATKVFSKALSKINTKYTIGLSATPDRDDGLSKVFHWYLGPMLYKMEKAKNKEVMVRIINFKLAESEPKKEQAKFREYKTRTGDTNSSLMLTNLSEIESRNRIIIKELQNIVSSEVGRNILILSSRINQLKILKEGFDLLNTGISTDYYIGKMKEKELKIAQERQILFATYEMVNEGFDLPKLNTLIFATPRSKIEQAVGRILRKQDADINPLVVDIIDELKQFKGQGYKRRKYYKELNYQISEF